MLDNESLSKRTGCDRAMKRRDQFFDDDDDDDGELDFLFVSGRKWAPLLSVVYRRNRELMLQLELMVGCG